MDLGGQLAIDECLFFVLTFTVSNSVSTPMDRRAGRFRYRDAG
jgi:hypothetical protein